MIKDIALKYFQGEPSGEEKALLYQWFEENTQADFRFDVKIKVQIQVLKCFNISICLEGLLNPFRDQSVYLNR